LLVSAEALTIVNIALATIFMTYSVINEYRLANILSLRSFINKLRENLQVLMNLNDKLSNESNKLVTQTESLKKKEDEVKGIVDKQNYSMDRFIKNMKADKDINEEMKETVDLLMYQTLVQFVISSDRSSDFTIHGKEIELLFVKLHAWEYFEINEGALRKIIAKHNGEIDGILTYLSKLIHHTEELEEDDLLDYHITEVKRKFKRISKRYSTMTDEHMSTRNACAIVAMHNFDISDDDSDSSDDEDNKLERRLKVMRRTSF